MVASLISFGLLLFIIYQPILFLILFYFASKKYPDFSFKTHWVSNLGEKNSKSYLYFVFGFLILAILGIFFAINMFHYLGFNFYGFSVVGSLIFAVISIFFVILYPMDINYPKHQSIAQFLLLALFLINVFSLLTIFSNSKFPIFLLLLNISGIVFDVLFSISGRMLFNKYKINELQNLTLIIKNEKNFLIKNTTVFEWLLFGNHLVGYF